MTDAATNPFEDAYNGGSPPSTGNPFEDAYNSAGQPKTSSIGGAFVRGAEQGVIPAVGGLAGAGAGAEVGGAVGGGIGALFGGVGAAPGALVGGVIGGIAGGLGGSYAAAKGQDYALSAAPDSWKEKIGLDDRQQQLDQQLHPYASFLGGLFPYALTLKPGGFTAEKLGENATSLQRIMANPVTARIFGGAVMGGMEAGQELASGESPDWAKIGISTGFGMVLNKPNAIGESIEGFAPRLLRGRPVVKPPSIPLAGGEEYIPQPEFGDYFSQLHDAVTQAPAENANIPGVIAPRPGESLGLRGLGNETEAFSINEPKPNYESTVIDWRSADLEELHDRLSEQWDNDGDILGLMAPTLAQAGDYGVMGTAFTEETFFRSEEPPRDAVNAAQNLARQEQEILGKPFKDVDIAARNSHEDLFNEYDSLTAQREAIRAHIERISNPPDEDIAAAQKRASDVKTQLEELVKQQKGYTGGAEARRLRAQLRDAEAEAADMAARREAYAAGKGKDTAEVTALRQHFNDIDYNLRDVSRQVAAARLRAAEGLGVRTVEPVPLPPERVAEPPKAETPAPAPAPVAAPIEEPAPAPNMAENLHVAPTAEAAPGEPIAASAPTVATPAPAPAPAPVAPRSIEEQRGYIEDDVRKQLLAANRPAGETEATAKLVSALYETHAERTGNTAEELYRSEPTKVKLSTKLKNAFGKLTPAGIIRLAKDANASTFIHELGHDWLERIVRDADLSGASQSLKDDAAAIKKWIGHKEGEIKTAAHEKFARGFERYLYEGAAPTRALAGVFAKFKGWLVEVYRALKLLPEPERISPDIREVFDRMLTSTPERTTLVPEAEFGPSLADIHEADATHVEPDEADAAADRVAYERDRYEAEMPPEVANELNPFLAGATAYAGADAGAEGGAGGAGLREVARPGGDAGSKPSNGGVGGGRGPVGESRTPAKAESGGVSGGAGREPDTGPQHHPLAGTPAERLDPVNGRLVDLAGNIRVENLTNVQEVAEAIHASADRNSDFKNVRGSMTKGQMVDLADAMGLDPSKVKEKTLGGLFGGTDNLGARVLAARKLVVESARVVSDSMARAAGSDDPQALIELAQTIQRHDMIQSALAGVTAEWGRAGSAFHSLLDGWDKAADVNQLLKQNTGRDLFQLKQIAELGKNLDSPGKVNKFLRDAQKRTFGKMILEFFINNLISGPATHVTYTIGNEALLLNKMGFETPVAAAIGALRSLRGREGERVFAGEARAGLQEHIRSLPRAVQSAIEGFRTGRTTLLPGEVGRPLTPFQDSANPIDLRPARTSTNADVTWKEAQADAFGAIQGMRDGFVAGATLDAAAPAFQVEPSAMGYNPNFRVKGVAIPLGGAIRLPSRFVAAIHSFFRTMNYSIENNGRAWRQATAEGLEGTAHSARVAELRQNPTDESMEKSRVTANDLTLMGQGGAFVDHLSKLMNWAPNLPILGETPVLKFIDPFVHIAANVIDQTLVHRTPVGLLSQTIREDLLGKNGNVAQDMAQARMLVGTAMATMFGGLAASGYMTGSGPSDRNKNAVWRQAGNQAHSIRVGDIWYDVHRMGPMGMLAGISADMYDVAQVASTGDMSNTAAMLMHAFTQNVLDESFMKGPSEWIQAINDPGRYGERVIQNFAASFVPYSVGLSQIDRAIDPYTRMTRTVMDAIKQKVPGLSDTLEPRRDIWGEPVPNHDALLAKGLTAIYEQRISGDPVNIELAKLGVGIAPVPKSIRLVKLDDQQYDDFARLAGRMTKQRFDTIINSPDWQMIPTATKLAVVQEIVKQCREAARGVMFMKYPQIVRDATNAEITRKGGTPLQGDEE